MRFVIGLLVSLAVGVGCRYFNIPVPSPPVVPGAVLVLAMTIGYSSTNALLNRKGNLATTAHLCGGPTGSTAATAKGRSAASSPNGE
jgi:XapX domain-containing protein